MAIQVYEDALAKTPKYLPAMNNLAMLLATYRTDKASLDRAAQLASALASSTDAVYLDTPGAG